MELTPDQEVLSTCDAELHSPPAGASKTFVVASDFTKEELEKRAEFAVILQKWINRKDEYPDEPEGTFERMIDENRSSARKLFPPELKGITW